MTTRFTTFTTYCHDPSAITPDAIAEYLRIFAAPNGVSGAIGVYRAIFESIQQTEPLTQNKVTTPILALGGDNVTGDRVQSMLQSVATDVQGGAVERCGHFIPDERPNVLLDQLFTFFDAVETRTTVV